MVVQPIHEAGLEILREAGIEPFPPSAVDDPTIAREIGNSVAVISRNAGFSRQAIEASSALEVIGVHGSGTDAVDVEYAHRRGVLVVSSPGFNVRSVAEHAIGLLLASARRTVQADRAVRECDGSFRQSHRFAELYAKTLCIIGWGRIGQLTARIAMRGLDMNVVVYSPRSNGDQINLAGATKFDRLNDALAQADAVSLHVPHTAETHHLIGRSELDALKPGALLVNTCRAAVIDQNALVDAMDDGRISVAALDVYDEAHSSAGDRLLTSRNAILTPHLGGTTGTALERTAVEIAQKVIDVLRGTITEDAFGYLIKSRRVAE